jgi:hypothetical protein
MDMEEYFFQKQVEINRIIAAIENLEMYKYTEKERDKIYELRKKAVNALNELYKEFEF